MNLHVHSDAHTLRRSTHGHKFCCAGFLGGHFPEPRFLPYANASLYRVCPMQILSHGLCNPLTTHPQAVHAARIFTGPASLFLKISLSVNTPLPLSWTKIPVQRGGTERWERGREREGNTYNDASIKMNDSVLRAVQTSQTMMLGSCMHKRAQISSIRRIRVHIWTHAHHVESLRTVL